MLFYNNEFYRRFYRDNTDTFLSMVEHYFRRTGKMRKDLKRYLKVWGHSDRTIRHWFQEGPPYEHVPHYGEFFGVPWQQLVCGREFKIDLSPKEADLLYLYQQMSKEEQDAAFEVIRLFAMKLENLSLM